MKKYVSVDRDEVIRPRTDSLQLNCLYTYGFSMESVISTIRNKIYASYDDEIMTEDEVKVALSTLGAALAKLDKFTNYKLIMSSVIIHMTPEFKEYINQFNDKLTAAVDYANHNLDIIKDLILEKCDDYAKSLDTKIGDVKVYLGLDLISNTYVFLEQDNVRIISYFKLSSYIDVDCKDATKDHYSKNEHYLDDNSFLEFDVKDLDSIFFFVKPLVEDNILLDSIMDNIMTRIDKSVLIIKKELFREEMIKEGVENL